MGTPLDLLTDLPSTRALVRASILAMGVGFSAAASGCGDAIAPTCGPCCHDPSSAACMAEQDAGVDAGEGAEDAGPVEVDAGDVVGPTCGPCCHTPEVCDAGL